MNPLCPGAAGRNKKGAEIFRTFFYSFCSAKFSACFALINTAGAIRMTLVDAHMTK